MFGLAAGRSAYPPVYSVNASTKDSKKERLQSKSKMEEASGASLEPAMDGPPSPERIRQYTEQAKRSSIFGNNSRSNTFSSTTSSARSRESVSSGENGFSLSRKSSARSNSNSMPSRSERPDSVQIFSSIFSRSGRKLRKDANGSMSTFSLKSPNITEHPIEEESGRDRSDEIDTKDRKGSESSIRHLISTPYNFEHVTHTQHEHLPNLQKSSQTELVSEFSAIRASQAPTKGDLKGIRTQDLHFENFSSESLSSPTNENGPPPALNPKSPRRQQSVPRRSIIPARLSTRSQDNLRSPPIRPPRSPISPPCPMELPARGSSRTASVFYDSFNPLASTTIERPHTNGGFRRPSPFNLPSPPLPSWSEQDTYFVDRSTSHAVTTPGDEAWPLPSSGTFGVELADVQEEEEPGSRLSRISQSSDKLRASQSVPALRVKSYEHEHHEIPQRSEARISTTLGPSHSVLGSGPPQQPLPPAANAIRDSWEDDVDFCYENEIEADCQYQWDPNSVAVRPPTTQLAPPAAPQPRLSHHLEDDERSAYHGRFRPSLLVPSSLDLPELSPISNDSSATSADLRTPASFLRPIHVRSHSHASSFKESHGFNLSPSLLIPTDFQSQMDQEALYDEHFSNHSTSGTIFPQGSFHHVSPMDESISSTASYRSSAFSRGSARSSSSTRISTANSRGSQDSVHILSRAASVSKAHTSIGSASSLPDLVPSALRNDSSSESEIPSKLASLNGSEETLDITPEATPAPITVVEHKRNKSLASEPGARRGNNHFAPPPAEVTDKKDLSPVSESFVESSKIKESKQPQIHGRKGSVPLAAMSVSRETKGRARSATASSVGGKTRGSYMLFPQTS